MKSGVSPPRRVSRASRVLAEFAELDLGLKKLI